MFLPFTHWVEAVSPVDSEDETNDSVELDSVDPLVISVVDVTEDVETVSDSAFENPIRTKIIEKGRSDSIFGVLFL